MPYYRIIIRSFTRTWNFFVVVLSRSFSSVITLEQLAILFVVVVVVVVTRKVERTSTFSQNNECDITILPVLRLEVLPISARTNQEARIYCYVMRLAGLVQWVERKMVELGPWTAGK